MDTIQWNDNEFYLVSQHEKDLNLLEAAEQGDINKIYLLIEAKVNINAKSTITQNTPLMQSIINRKFEAAALLINQEADLDAINQHGDNALKYAAMDKSATKIVELLFNKGAKIESSDEKGQTAIMLAAHFGCTATVDFLITKNANLKAKDKWNNTPTMFAARKGHTAIVAAFIKAGADLHTPALYGNTALSFAVEEKHIGTALLLFCAMTQEQIKLEYERCPKLSVNFDDLRIRAARINAFKKMGVLFFDKNKNNLFYHLPMELMGIIFSNCCSPEDKTKTTCDQLIDANALSNVFKVLKFSEFSTEDKKQKEDFFNEVNLLEEIRILKL